MGKFLHLGRKALLFPRRWFPAEIARQAQPEGRGWFQVWFAGERVPGFVSELSATSYDMIFVMFYVHIFLFVMEVHRIRFCWYWVVFIFHAILYN